MSPTVTRGCGGHGVSEGAGGAVSTRCSPGSRFSCSSDIQGGISHTGGEGWQGAIIPETSKVHCWREGKMVGKFKGDLVVAGQDVVRMSSARVKIVKDLPGLVVDLRAAQWGIECQLGLGGWAVNALGV